MGTRSGLDGQCGFVTEGTWGTAGTPSKFVEVDDENFVFNPTWLENEGLAAGRVFKRASRVGISRLDVNGQLTLKHGTKGYGTLWKHALGSGATPTQIASTTAYKQIHTYSARYGLGLTMQIGRAEEATGTVVPFTYNGCKVTSWEFSVSDGEAAKLVLNMDGQTETTSTALASASYPTAQHVFTFKDVSTFTLGGTATTSAGETTVGSPTAVATVVRSLMIHGDVPLAGERYGLGNQGLKNQQIENGYATVTGSMDAEFGKAELYDVFKAGNTTTLQLAMTFGDAGGGNPYLLSFILPAVLLKTAAPSVNGPDLVPMTTTFEAYDDGSGTNPVLQVKVVSTDTAI